MTDEKVKISLLNQIYGSVLTERQRAVLERFYDCDCSLGEIAQEFCISRQAVMDAVKKGSETLLKMELKIGFLSVKQQLSDCIEQLKTTDDIVKIADRMTTILE